MRVKKLELLGFKSFETKTTVHFEPGVTAIVGPNGSGKTNLVDAVRWVLGEHNPRDVRAPRLEDVIFNGTDTKAPLSMAEVSLMIENEDGHLPIAFSEVVITRRVYRSGMSECFINQSPCRLKDIQELFLGTGLGGGTYAIIEQGHIDLILSAKPEERRIVFEEASGVAKYLAKKQETLRRLDDVEQDLLRLADITQEVRRQLLVLERQAAKARQYKTLWEQLKELELRVAADELRQGAQGHQELLQRVESLKHKHTMLDEERQRHLASLGTFQSTVAKTQADLQVLTTRVVESTGQIEQHESQLALKTRWIEELTQQQQRLAQEEAHLDERAKQLAHQRERLAAQQAELERQHKDLLTQRANASEELTRLDRLITEGLKVLEQGKGELFEVASQASQQRNALADATLRLQTVEAQLARIQEQRSAVLQRLEQLTLRQQSVERERQHLKDQEDSLRREVELARQSTSQAEAKRHELLGRFNGLRERLLGERAKVQLLEEVWRRDVGFPESVKTLLAEPPEGVLGLLADLLDPQPGYEQAIEAALGPLASAIVVQNRSALRRCQELLAEHKLDAVHVVVLSDCPGQPTAPRPNPPQEGFLGRLSQFVRYDRAIACLVEWLLGSWGLVDDIKRLMHTTVPQGSWVSKTGDRWDGLSWTLAGSGMSGRVGRKQRWTQAREALEALEHEVAALAKAAQDAEGKWQSRLAHEDTLRQQVAQLTPHLTGLAEQLSFVRHEAKRLQEELERHELDSEELLGQQRELVDAQHKARHAVAKAEASQRTLEETLKDTQGRHDEAKTRHQQLLVSGAQLDTAITSCAERTATIQTRLGDLQAEQVQAASQLEAKRLQAKGTLERIAELEKQQVEHRAQIASLTEERARCQAEVDRITPTLREQERTRGQVLPKLVAVEQELLSVTQQLQEQETQLAELIFRRTRVIERLQELYHIEEATVLAEQGTAPSLTAEERQALTQQIERLKAKLKTWGEVSGAVVEEYDELKARLEFLQTQQQDLIKARDDLRSSIQQINRTARAQFRETFAKIRQEFQHYFAQLFGGGQADLILLDEEDVLESGIEIVARPPGKRLQSISLLSGGERALTAIGLLFALFKVRPSPCCILDEIDAPLDEANIDRFTRVLEEFLSLSQFILITHNKQTITKAGCLYGVTMEQAGVSKIVSVKLTKSTRPVPAEPAPAAVAA